MKRKFTLLFLLATFVVTISKAQVLKGTATLGGNLSFSNYSSKDDNNNKYKSTDVSIAPSFAKAYKDNRVMGVILRYRYNGKEISDLNANSFGAGFFLRQYKPLGKGFYIFGQEALNFDFNQYKDIRGVDSVYIIETQKQGGVSITINPGLAYDLNKKLQLELLFFNNLISAGYAHTKHEFTKTQNSSNPDYRENNFYVSSNLDWSQLSSVNVGLKIYLNR